MSRSGPVSKHRIFFRLQRAAHALKKRADTALFAEGGVTTAQTAALMIIDQQGPISQREIARILDQNESAITAMVRRLMALEYVERERSEQDSRRWDLKITETGRRTLNHALPAFAQVNELIENRLTAAEIALLARLLDAVLAGVQSE